MLSLGREPQDSAPRIIIKPRRGDRLVLRREPQRLATFSVAAPRLFNFFFIAYLGLTPQAKYMSPLRGSIC